MISSRKGRALVALALVLLSAHLAFGLYPLPTQRAEDIRRIAEETFPVSKPNPDMSQSDTSDELRQLAVESMSRELWQAWVFSLVGLSLSIFAAGLALFRHRWWTLTTLVACIFFLSISIPPLIGISITTGSVFHWIRVSASAAFREGTMAGAFFVYQLFVLPILYLILAFICSVTWWTDSRGASRVESN